MTPGEIEYVYPQVFVVVLKTGLKRLTRQLNNPNNLIKI